MAFDFPDIRILWHFSIDFFFCSANSHKFSKKSKRKTKRGENEPSEATKRFRTNVICCVRYVSYLIASKLSYTFGRSVVFYNCHEWSVRVLGVLCWWWTVDYYIVLIACSWKQQCEDGNDDDDDQHLIRIAYHHHHCCYHSTLVFRLCTPCTIELQFVRLDMLHFSLSDISISCFRFKPWLFYHSWNFHIPSRKSGKQTNK